MNKRNALILAVVLTIVATPISLLAEPALTTDPTATATEPALATSPTETTEPSLTAGPTTTQTEPALTTSPTGTSAETAVNSSPTATTPAPEPAKSADRTGEGMITPGQTLTLNQCVEIALRKNPNIVAATNQADVFKNRVWEARSVYFPQLGAAANYTRNDITTGPTSTILNPGSSIRTDLYAGNVTLKQTILDVGSLSNVDVAKYNFASSNADLYTVLNNTVLTVKQAYYQVLQAKRNRDVAADVIKQFQLHLDQAKGFYDVGTKAKIDVIKAEVDLSNAKLSLINADNALKIAWVNLNNAMGVPDAPAYSIEDNLSFQQYIITLEDATARAFENRPDLKSAIARRQAAESSISVARSGYYPTLSGTASYTKSGTGLASSDLTDSWSAGVVLTLPLFNGFLTSHQVAEAKSNFYVLRANEEALRQQILLDVRQSYLNLQAADASISTAQLAAAQAKENLDLANGRYAAGVGSPVEVSDAFATYVTAEANYTSALANYKIAQATIERAMGVR